MNSERLEEALALYALGVPTELLAKQYGTTPGALRRYASDAKVRRPLDPDRKWMARVARAERISRNAAEYPGTSLFSTLEAAA